MLAFAEVPVDHLILYFLLVRSSLFAYFRGQMGLSEDEQRTAQELRLQNNGGASRGGIIRQSSEVAEMNTRTCGSHPKANGCCRANGNTECCQHPAVSGKKNSVAGDHATEVAAERKNKKQLSRNNSYKVIGKRKVCSMPSWFENWEREDTYAALAVACAAVSIGIAYRCYKQL